MASARIRKVKPPLEPEALRELALVYVGKYATTNQKLRRYLQRKIRERGWHDDGDAPVDDIVERFSANGFVDDLAYANAKTGSLLRRGYGAGRIRTTLMQAGIARETTETLSDIDEDAAMAAALAFAKRRRFGPYGSATKDADVRRRQLAAFLRAGHSFAISKRIVDLDGEIVQDLAR
jgi:regulatory protein